MVPMHVVGEEYANMANAFVTQDLLASNVPKKLRAKIIVIVMVFAKIVNVFVMKVMKVTTVVQKLHAQQQTIHHVADTVSVISDNANATKHTKALIVEKK